MTTVYIFTENKTVIQTVESDSPLQAAAQAYLKAGEQGLKLFRFPAAVVIHNDKARLTPRLLSYDPPPKSNPRTYASTLDFSFA